MAAWDQINCTRIGRYSGGERKGFHSSKHPLVQFLICPTFQLKNALPISEIWGGNNILSGPLKIGPSRIEQFGDKEINIADIGCSTGAATLSFYETLRQNIFDDTKINMIGIDNDEKTLISAWEGKATYESAYALLHNRVYEAIDEYFCEEKAFTKNRERYDFEYTFSIKPKGKQKLQEMLKLADAQEIPLEDNSTHFTICTFVLRYEIGDSTQIFKELKRITKPGGYIFLEEFAFQKEKDGSLRYLSPYHKDMVNSFYHALKYLSYRSTPGGNMYRKDNFDDRLIFAKNNEDFNELERLF